MVQASTLLTGVQTGTLDILVQMLLAATAAFYLISLRRSRMAGRRIPLRRGAAFLAGLFAVWVAVGSSLAGYDDTNVTCHVVQHLLLMMVAPPLLVLGRPLVLAMQVAPRRTQARVARVLASTPVRALTHPVVAWTLYFGSMAVMLTDRTVFHYLIHHEIAHDASHAWLLVAGLLYWEPLLGGAASTRRVAPAVRVMAVLANMPFEVLIGIWLRYQMRPLDPANTVADTQRAGEAFIVGATFVSTVWLVGLVLQWGAAARREERRTALRPMRAEWTTPWWMEAAGSSGPAERP